MQYYTGHFEVLEANKQTFSIIGPMSIPQNYDWYSIFIYFYFTCTFVLHVYLLPEN